MSDTQLVKSIAQQLLKYNLTIATAESCTGGLLSHLLTNVPGSSHYFQHGIITYSNSAKQHYLDVPEMVLEEYGAVSQQTAHAMAVGIRDRAEVDIGLSTTGIAGPGGGTEIKPVGLVYVGIATRKTVEVKQFQFKGSRLYNKKRTCSEALQLLYDHLNNW